MSTKISDDKFIDLEDVIRKKNPRLLKIMPSFAINYLKRIIHQDEMNDALSRNHHLVGLDFVKAGLNELGTQYEVFGAENIPSSGRYIFVSNHPLGGLDGLVLMNEIGKRYPDLKFVVNDILVNVKNLQPLFVPVNKHGRQTAEYARYIDQTYSSNTQVLYFPAGLCSRKIKGQITDLLWQKSFITKATQYQRDIIPVYFDGQNSNFFYRLANLRKRLGIKGNIEMLYLVDEMFRQRNNKLRLVFGEPISYQTLDKSKSSMEWANLVREKAYQLKLKLPTIDTRLIK